MNTVKKISRADELGFADRGRMAILPDGRRGHLASINFGHIITVSLEGERESFALLPEEIITFEAAA